VCVAEDSAVSHNRYPTNEEAWEMLKLMGFHQSYIPSHVRESLSAVYCYPKVHMRHAVLEIRWFEGAGNLFAHLSGGWVSNTLTSPWEIMFVRWDPWEPGLPHTLAGVALTLPKLQARLAELMQQFKEANASLYA